ncbi:hypothetical protein [Amycolatopsis thermoflava]|uniref:hypothetical protein n=1 Tax=Amycolatopsis thermoflava TaxID=84480 RepID=UPI003655F426
MRETTVPKPIAPVCTATMVTHSSGSVLSASPGPPAPIVLISREVVASASTPSGAGLSRSAPKKQVSMNTRNSTSWNISRDASVSVPAKDTASVMPCDRHRRGTAGPVSSNHASAAPASGRVSARWTSRVASPSSRYGR